MLIKLEVENFRSFNKNQVFHTIQRGYKRFSDHIYTFEDELRLLKTTGIYGGNASGKTNLFNALFFVKMMVQEHDYLNSFAARKLLSPFRIDKDSESRDSIFEIDFISNDKIYNYKLQVNKKLNRVTFESLTKISDEKQTLIFDRVTNIENVTDINIPVLNDHKELLTSISRLIPTSATFLSLPFLPESLSIDAKSWFIEKVKFQYPIYDFNDIAYILSLKDEYLVLANKIIDFAKTGIHELRINKIPIEIYLGTEKNDQIEQISAILKEKKYHPFLDSNGNFCTAVRNSQDSIDVLKLITIHMDKKGNEVIFDLDQESRGTIALFHLLPAFILSYGEGVNYFIDEIGASLHPILLKEILSQYLKYNIKYAKGQLIFNTHEEFIMDENIIRQDEIWLVEKENNETELFPLSDIPNVRFDLDLKKNYLNGKFGGVPFDEKPENLIFDENRNE